MRTLVSAVHLRSCAAVTVDQRPLISFSRFARLLERIGEVQHYRAPVAANLLEKHHHPSYHPHRCISSSGDGIGGHGCRCSGARMGKCGALERAEQHIAREVRGAREGASGEGAPDTRDARARASLARPWAARSTPGHEGPVGALTPCAVSPRWISPAWDAPTWDGCDSPPPSRLTLCFLSSPYIYGVISFY